MAIRLLYSSTWRQFLSLWNATHECFMENWIQKSLDDWFQSTLLGREYQICDNTLTSASLPSPKHTVRNLYVLGRILWWPTSRSKPVLSSSYSKNSAPTNLGLGASRRFPTQPPNNDFGINDFISFESPFNISLEKSINKAFGTTTISPPNTQHIYLCCSILRYRR